jgi:diguanylate cyclase (GGDEF)-like protein
VISLKKYLEMDVLDERSRVLLAAVLESYRSTLLCVGKNGVRACPSVGLDLQKNLAELEGRLSDETTPTAVKATEKAAEEELQKWAGRSAEYLKAKANEVKELLVVLANTAESIVERDQKYASQFSQFTTRLQSIADLEDLGQVRASLLQGANELKTCIDRMTQDSQRSVQQLRAECSTYESQLKTVQQLAMQDALTGLPNRRAAEERIEWRIAHKQAFCVMMIDVDGFKQVNDSYGHVAGDHLLQQFAEELRSNSRTPDIVGRWGGDEFIAVLDCDAHGAKSRLERLRKWVLGEYTLHVGNPPQPVRVPVDASVGIAEWSSGETLSDLIQRADADMYAEKQAKK